MLDQVQDLLLILIGSSLVSNVVLSQFLGLCPFLGVSKKVETAVIIATDMMTPKIVTMVLRRLRIIHASVTRFMIFIGGSPHPG